MDYIIIMKKIMANQENKKVMCTHTHTHTHSHMKTTMIINVYMNIIIITASVILPIGSSN